MNRNTTNKNKLLTLCSAAVMCVASYAAVESASLPFAQASTVAKSSQATHGTAVVTPNKSHVAAKTIKKPVLKQKYKDGTYTGTGYTRIGAVQVAVTLKRDKITNVQIKGYSTHYPISYINPVLPQELLSRQNINKIDVVSGATLSTEDFYYGVVSALQQAQQAEKRAASSSQTHA